MKISNGVNIFLIWSSKTPDISVLISELEKHSHQILYWVSDKDTEKYKPAETIFHDHYDALAARPAEGVDMADFLPPDEELIAKMSRTESIFLTMMNKLYFRLDLNERKRLYYKMLGYWHGVIKKYRPEVIIFPTIPHSVYNYLIYELARLLNIKTICFDYTKIGGRRLMYHDWTESNPALVKELEKNKDTIFSLNDLSSDLREYYNLNIKDTAEAIPEYFKKVKNISTGKNFLSHKFKIAFAAIKNGTIFKKALAYIKKLKNNPEKEYEKLLVNPDLAERFIYLPLHYQPECTTSPQGGAYVDQILMIETLAAVLPADWVIYVKEHPGQIWSNGLNYSSCRYPGYYEKISKIKNVRLIPLSTSSFSLIRNCQAVATVAGTAGWEAILREKPAIIFGYPWYRDCPGAFKVNGAEGCRRALSEITGGYKINQAEIINYLKCLDNVAIAGQAGLSEEAIMKNMAEAIIEDIK